MSLFINKRVEFQKRITIDKSDISRYYATNLFNEV